MNACQIQFQESQDINFAVPKSSIWKYLLSNQEYIKILQKRLKSKNAMASRDKGAVNKSVLRPLKKISKTKIKHLLSKTITKDHISLSRKNQG